MTTQTFEAVAPMDLPTGYTVRPPMLADVTAVVAMLNRDSQALLGVNGHTVDDWAADWQSPSFQLAANALLVLAPDGAAVAYAHLWDAAPHVQLEQFGCVDPGHTRRGLGGGLLAWLGQRAPELMLNAPTAARLSLTAWVNSLDTGTRACWARMATSTCAATGAWSSIWARPPRWPRPPGRPAWAYAVMCPARMSALP